MLFSKSKIIELASDLIIKDDITGNPQYDWIDVLGIPQRPGNLHSSLYFSTHSDGNDGWHNAFDRRPIAREVAQDKGWHIATESKLDTPNHLVVSSLPALAQRLYDHTRSVTKPYVIGVTGSVGKTTTVAFLEHLLKTSGHTVTRFWSKRLSPLLVQCHYINRINPDTEFIVMEYSAFLKDHVSRLSTVLPPHLSFFTNIYEEHIESGLFKDLLDIYHSKIQIKPQGSTGYINRSILEKLQLALPPKWKNFQIDTEIIAQNHLLPPTLRTAELYTVGQLVSEELNIPKSVLAQAFSSFIPQENRLMSCTYHGGSLFFDGEASCGSRLWSWFETTNGKVPTFLVEEISFGTDDTSTYTDLLKNIFNSPDTFVLDTPDNRKNIPVPASFVTKNKFAQLLKQRTQQKEYVVYVKSMATRQPEFNAQQYLNDRW